MDRAAAPHITALLERWRRGDREAEAELMETLYPVLRAMAQHELGSGFGAKLTVRATELAHEAYLRLFGQQNPYESRGHFLALAGRMIRRVLVDLLRKRQAEKRGALLDIVPLHGVAEEEQASVDDTIDLLALDQALETLAKRDAIAAQVVELRYFSGLTNDEVAGVLDVGVATVVRHWQFGRAWLHRRL